MISNSEFPELPKLPLNFASFENSGVSVFKPMIPSCCMFSLTEMYYWVVLPIWFLENFIFECFE